YCLVLAGPPPTPPSSPYTPLFRSHGVAQRLPRDPARARRQRPPAQPELRLQAEDPVDARTTGVTVDHQGAPAARRSLGERTGQRSEEHTSELQSRENLVCRLLLEK